MCVIRMEGTPYLCRMDEVGEICVSSISTGISYYGLPGMTKNVFEVNKRSNDFFKCSVSLKMFNQYSILVLY